MRDEPDEDEDETPAPPVEVPPLIADFAASAVDYVRHATGVEPALDAETLSVVDWYLGTVAAVKDELDAVVPLVSRTVGAYFGEVIRRRFGGFWRAPGQDAHEWWVCLGPALVAVNPVGAVYDALYGGTEHDGPDAAPLLDPSARHVVAERLRSLGELPEDQFHLLTTRLEVLDAIVETLRSEEAEDEAATFGPDEYDELFALTGPRRPARA